MNYLPDQAEPKSYDDVPLVAFCRPSMLSELKTSFFDRIPNLLAFFDSGHCGIQRVVSMAC